MSLLCWAKRRLGIRSPSETYLGRCTHTHWLRIPYRPRRALTLGGRPNPVAVRVTAHGGDVPVDVSRVASAPGWMVLLVRYDQEVPPAPVIRVTKKEQP